MPPHLPSKNLDPRPLNRRLSDALLILFAPRRAIQRLSAADWEVTGKRQPELQSSPASVREAHSEHQREITALQVRRLRAVHASAIALVISAAAVPAISRALFGDPNTAVKSGCALASVGVFAWATLARLGWAGQTIKGDMAVERVDEVWFRALYWIGVLLGGFAII